MKNNYKIGRNGEAIAQKYLEKNGYKIITTNYYTRKGEIDIIATQGKEIIFIEVKTRSSIEFGRPIESVTKNKQKHMYQTAKYYIHKTKQETKCIRFDVIEVYIINGKIKVNHIKQIL